VDRPNHLHAGRKPSIDQRSGDPLGVLAMLRRCNDLDEFGHGRQCNTPGGGWDSESNFVDEFSCSRDSLQSSLNRR